MNKVTYKILSPLAFSGSTYGDYGYVLNGVKSERGYVTHRAARQALERVFIKMRKSGEVTDETSFVISANAPEVPETKNEWSIDKVALFMQCRSCLEAGRAKGMSPQEYGQLEGGSHNYEYPDGHVEGVVALFCKHCGLMVWNSSHLTQR